MIISLNWLADYVQVQAPVDTIVERLLMSGLNHASTAAVGGDTAVEIEVTSNRPDCLGHIGVGGQGSGLLQNFLSAKGATSVAIADPFRHKREAAGQRVKQAQGHEPKLYNDFRDLLADDSIDAVVIAVRRKSNRPELKMAS